MEPTLNKAGAMVMKKMHTMGFMRSLEPKGTLRTRQATASNKPTILGGKQLTAIPLPADFDPSVHLKAKKSGVKATPLSEMLDMIAVLEGRKPQVG